MARRNVVELYGYVGSKPYVEKKIKRTTGDEYENVTCMLVVIRAYKTSSTGNYMVAFDLPRIVTKDPELGKILKSAMPNDILRVKGVLTTKAVNKIRKCEHCGSANRREGIKVYVKPVHVSIEKRHLTESEAQEDIKNNISISNNAYAIGYLCKNPKPFRSTNGSPMVSYKLAVDRSKRLQDFETDSPADYIWVKSFGYGAIEDFKRLHAGSCVAVEGFIHTKEYQKNYKCPSCGKNTIWKDYSMEIIPYSTEYCNNFNSDEEIKADNTKKDDAIEKKMEEHQLTKDKEFDEWTEYEADHVETLKKQDDDSED